LRSSSLHASTVVGHFQGISRNSESQKNAISKFKDFPGLSGICNNPVGKIL